MCQNEILKFVHPQGTPKNVGANYKNQQSFKLPEMVSKCKLKPTWGIIASHPPPSPAPHGNEIFVVQIINRSNITIA